MTDIAPLLARLEQFLERAERLLPGPRRTLEPTVRAWRWQKAEGPLPITRPARIALDELLHLARQREILERNTLQFVRGLPANNALLWGARGTGKSSLVKALFARYANDGLRVIEADREALVELPHIADAVEGRPERFIVFADDLSFEADDPSYKALKALLDGSLAAAPENLLIYATSNRRHLMPEFMRENLETRLVDGEIHQGDAVEEKISLSERFGLWVSFHPFTQDQYLDVVRHHLHALGVAAWDEARALEAVRYAQGRGSRSGRVAAQFARDLAGRLRLTT
ncbi:MAG: ATP-binding protein [Halothiobacillaceae bacterium]|nr:ATP-binding protein [Halothiobacillaceae bacterium]